MPRLTSAARWVLPALVALLWLGLAGPLGSLGGGLATCRRTTRPPSCPTAPSPPG